MTKAEMAEVAKERMEKAGFKNVEVYLRRSYYETKINGKMHLFDAREVNSGCELAYLMYMSWCRDMGIKQELPYKVFKRSSNYLLRREA